MNEGRCAESERVEKPRLTVERGGRLVVLGWMNDRYDEEGGNDKKRQTARMTLEI